MSMTASACSECCYMVRVDSTLLTLLLYSHHGWIISAHNVAIQCPLMGAALVNCIIKYTWLLKPLNQTAKQNNI